MDLPTELHLQIASCKPLFFYSHSPCRAFLIYILGMDADFFFF